MTAADAADETDEEGEYTDGYQLFHDGIDDTGVCAWSGARVMRRWLATGHMKLGGVVSRCRLTHQVDPRVQSARVSTT